MKANFALALFASVAVTSALAKPTLSTPVVSFNESTCLLTVRYTLSEPAVVTARLSTNAVPVRPAGVKFLVGDINKFVGDTSEEHAFYWQLAREAAAGFDVSQLKVALTAWQTDLMPDYMVVSLDCKHDVRYYETAGDVPGGLGKTGSDFNRKNCIVMRRIPAKGVTFRMGFTDSQAEKYVNLTDAAKANYYQHYVTLTNDYYMGVYPVTQTQYVRFVSSNPSSFAGFDESPILPVEGMTYNAVRGATTDDPKIDWPTTRYKVGASSYLGKLRAFTGVMFDLPTDAQWEYAARAGSQTQLPNNKEMSGNGNSFGDANCNDCCWNKQVAQEYWGSGVYQPGPVGWLEANGWGLYDVIGNVSELCRDWFQGDITQLADNASDPEGPTTGTTRVWHGGPCIYNVVNNVISRRGSNTPGSGNAKQLGFRLWAPCDARATAE